MQQTLSSSSQHFGCRCLALFYHMLELLHLFKHVRQILQVRWSPTDFQDPLVLPATFLTCNPSHALHTLSLPFDIAFSVCLQGCFSINKLFELVWPSKLLAAVYWILILFIFKTSMDYSFMADLFRFLFLLKHLFLRGRQVGTFL